MGCRPPHLGNSCAELFCEKLTPLGRPVFYTAAALQGIAAAVLIGLAVGRVVALCRSGRGWRSPQLLVFVHVGAVALEALATAVDPSGWCGLIPYGTASLLDDGATSLCFNLAMLLASAYTAAVVGKQGLRASNHKCRCNCAPCGVQWPLWVAMAAVFAAMVGCSAAMYSTGSTATYVIGTAFVKPILMMTILGLCMAAVMLLGARISCILRELHAVQREEQRRWIERMRGRLSEQERVSADSDIRLGVDRSSSLGSSGGAIEAHADISASWDPWSASSFADASAAVTSDARRAAADAEKRTFHSLHEGTSRLRHQLRKLHCTVATSILLCLVTVGGYVYDLVKGREIFAEWQDGGCVEPWCDMYAPSGSNATRRGQGTDASR